MRRMSRLPASYQSSPVNDHLTLSQIHSAPMMSSRVASTRSAVAWGVDSSGKNISGVSDDGVTVFWLDRSVAVCAEGRGESQLRDTLFR
jgi:hypothetical protein